MVFRLRKIQSASINARLARPDQLVASVKLQHSSLEAPGAATLLDEVVVTGTFRDILRFFAFFLILHVFLNVSYIYILFMFSCFGLVSHVSQAEATLTLTSRCGPSGGCEELIGGKRSCTMTETYWDNFCLNKMQHIQDLIASCSLLHAWNGFYMQQGPTRSKPVLPL